jgi:hypothetical protein
LKYSLNSSFIISFDLDDINNKEDNWKPINQKLLCKTMNETNLWDMVIVVTINIINFTTASYFMFRKDSDL